MKRLIVQRCRIFIWRSLCACAGCHKPP